MMCKCPKLKFPDCSDACLVPGAPLVKGYHKAHPHQLHPDASSTLVTTVKTEQITANSPMTYHGVDASGNKVGGAPITRSFRFAKTSWRTGAYADTTNRRRLSSNVVQDFIEIQCADYCADIEAVLADPTFTEKLAESTGDTPVVNQGSIMIAPAASVAAGTVTTNTVVGESTHSEKDYETYERATIALAVLLILAVLIMIYLGIQVSSLKNRQNTGVSKFGETEAALNDANAYEV